MRPPPPPELLASNHPVLTALIFVALGLYLVALVAAAVRPAWARWVLSAGAAVHFAGTVGRGLVIGFLPLTNKHESFSAAALATAIAGILAWRPARAFAVAHVAVVCLALGAALRFPLDLGYPAPLLHTAWYVLHVPLSFLAYGTWTAAAASAISWLVDRDDAWLARLDRLALWGFGLWSLSMLFGGIWGVVAWGATFMWDPKIVWSVILWLHYATFIHLRLTPSLTDRAWVRPAMALAGFVFVIVAYVGTSFVFGRSSHAF